MLHERECDMARPISVFPRDRRGRISAADAALPRITRHSLSFRTHVMLFIFNRQNRVHIAWHGRGPSARSRDNQMGGGRISFVRTWSAG